MNPPWLRETADGVYLAFKVQPRASRNKIGETLGSELKIAIAAPPVDSAANEELVAYLAKVLDYPKSSIQLVRGQASRHKSVFVRGANSAYIMQRIEDT